MRYAAWGVVLFACAKPPPPAPPPPAPPAAPPPASVTGDPDHYYCVPDQGIVHCTLGDAACADLVLTFGLETPCERAPSVFCAGDRCYGSPADCERAEGDNPCELRR